uniref:hypothetical protein n=1 Tax=Cetobacterium sp. ZOR0034 TaxID=1339239 RepID=UPI0006488C0A
MRKIKRKSYKDIFKRSYAIKLLKNKYLIKGFLKENEKLKINIFQIRGKEIYVNYPALKRTGLRGKYLSNLRYLNHA